MGDPVTKISFGVRKGTLDSIAESIADKENEFGKKFNLTAIVINDDESAVEKHWENQEGYKIDFKVPVLTSSGTKDVTLKEITRIIPSSVWRGIPIPPRGDESRPGVIAKRKELKRDYEARICQALKEAKVDILISNSYTNIIGPVLLGEFKGRIINIHPAITCGDNPCRLPGVTPTRDAFTRATEGFVITDDKKSVSLDGEEVEVEYDGETRKAVTFKEENRYTHGVTVHVVTAGVDEGPPILTKCYDLRDQFNIAGSDPSKPEITEEAIRDYNYDLKPVVLKEAILKYIERDEVKALLKEKRSE